MILPTRWVPLHEFLQVLLAPLPEGGDQVFFLVEANGPDGQKWTSLRPQAIPLGSPDATLVITRAVARLCGATRGQPDPGPAGQDRCGVYYSPTAFLHPRRADTAVAATTAIVLDIDDRDHGSRSGSLEAAARVPRPTALVHSGGGVQLVFVLREALSFDREDAPGLERAARDYVRAALALEHATGADPTHWPSHLFRCPCTYHLKHPDHPVLVQVEIEPERRFNLGDFDELTAAEDPTRLKSAVDRLVERLTGCAPRCSVPPPLSSVSTFRRSDGLRGVSLPRRVAPTTVGLLNHGMHPSYMRADGSLDRSRAVYAAGISLLAAGIPPDQVEAMLASSALRGAVEDRGEYGPEWLHRQVGKAATYLASGRSSGGQR